MILAFACAGIEFLAWKLGESIGRTLVGGDAVIAGVVGVRPYTFSGSFIAWATQITHGPDTGPETWNCGGAWKRDRYLEDTAFETKLVPRVEHTGLISEVMVCKSIHA